MDNNLACCIMTYNHPDVIELVLNNMYQEYDEHGIDIYIYDSSEGKDTENIVNRIISQGAANVFYIDARCYGGDEKIVCMLHKMGFTKEYDYVWNSKDRCFFIGKALDDIVAATKEGHDVIFGVDEGERWELVEPELQDVYTDPAVFYSHYGALATNWECLIRKTSTMLDGYDLEEFARKYQLGKDNSFNQPVSIFARLAELEKCSIKVIHDAGKNRVYSLLASSGWVNQIYTIWIDRWIAANESLPDIYTPYKDRVIKLETNMPQLFGSTDRFMYFKDHGLYTAEVFEQYKEVWPRLTNLPVRYLEYIAYGRIEELVAEVLESFEGAFLQQNYNEAYNIFATNQWMNLSYGENMYKDMSVAFAIYREQINKKGYCTLFKNVFSPIELVDKYRKLKGNTHKYFVSETITWDEFKCQINALLDKKDKKEIASFVNEEAIVKKFGKYTEFGIIFYVVRADILEAEGDISHTILDIVESADELIHIYQQFKFLLWEIEFANDQNALVELNEFIKSCNVSDIFVDAMIDYASLDREKMREILML